MKLNNLMEIKTKFQTVDEYISAAPEQARDHLNTLRRIIREAAPEALELISYNMPAFRFHGILLYYAAHQRHLGFYPANVKFREVFRKELEKYETSKGTIRFPYGDPLPVDLVREIAAFRKMQNQEKAAGKAPERIRIRPVQTKKPT
jgi:uncharacterized protein YdhG (YjbR/CyaY superfamily)